MAGRNFLFVPGPTNVPDRVLRAMHVAMEDHRSPNFPSLTKPLFGDLKKIFKTESAHCVVFTGSGTGGWEAALTNTLSPGDKVLSARFGQFSDLWTEMALRLNSDGQPGRRKQPERRRFDQAVTKESQTASRFEDARRRK